MKFSLVGRILLAMRRADRVRRAPEIQCAIDHAGSLNELAAACGVSTGTLSKWTRVPERHVETVERVGGVPRWELRPDLYPSPADADPGLAEGMTP